MLKHARRASVLVWWFATALPPCLAAGTAVDLSTPKTAAASYYRALFAGDVAAAKSAAIGGDREFMPVHAISDVNLAAEKLRNAVSERFGAEFGASLHVGFASGQGQDFVRKIESANERVEGDTARVFPPGREKDATRLRKIDGRWKVLLEAQAYGPTFMNSMTVLLPRLTRILNDTAEEVRKGEYRTPQELSDHLQRVLQAMGHSQTMPARASGADFGGVKQASDGILTLWASDAHLKGRCALGDVGDVRAVTHWDDRNEVITWDASVRDIHRPFEVMLTYAADLESAGAEYVVEIGSQTFSGKTVATGGAGQWAQFNSVALGTLGIEKAGPIRVAIKCLKKPGAAVMALRAVVLKPATQEDVQRRLAASHRPVAGKGHIPGFAISVDVSEVPEWEDWGIAVRSYLGKWYPVIDRRLHSDGFSPPRVFGVRVISVINATHKDASGRTIYTTAFANEYHTLVASQSWARMDNLGMMAHEMTHIIQSYPPSEFLSPMDQFWPREGIADYMRYYVVEPGSKYAAFDHSAANYHNGYQDTAAFLNWIEITYGSGPSGSVIARVNDALRHATYSPALFKQLTGKSVDELWQEFKKTF